MVPDPEVRGLEPLQTPERNHFEDVYLELIRSGKRVSGNQFVKMANCNRKEGLSWFKQRRAS